MTLKFLICFLLYTTDVNYMALMNYSIFWVIMRCKVVKNRRFRTTYWSNLQGSSFSSSWRAWPLKMGPIIVSKRTFLHHLMPPNNPKDVRIHLNHSRRLRSHVALMYCAISGLSYATCCLYLSHSVAGVAHQYFTGTYATSLILQTARIQQISILLLWKSQFSACYYTILLSTCLSY